ncbi:MAG: AmmeMemoRadiSam system protein A [Deltaproteobacteria bacterium]|nr:AmmeMemoRadiSam system protein A [Deltaproteobacteria bacterium]
MSNSALTTNEKKILLNIARGSIKAHLDKEHFDMPLGLPSVLSEKRGAFVTLTIDDELKGCIGVFEPETALKDTVAQMARSAAFHDPRFTPLTKEELPLIEIEISALTPLRKIPDVKEIEIGRHGLYIIKGKRRGVLLPQVAIEHGFDREEFLKQTCLKAGIEKNAWKDKDTEIYVFEAEIFSEAEFKNT